MIPRCETSKPWSRTAFWSVILAVAGVQVTASLDGLFLPIRPVLGNEVQALRDPDAYTVAPRAAGTPAAAPERVAVRQGTAEVPGGHTGTHAPAGCSCAAPPAASAGS